MIRRCALAFVLVAFVLGVTSTAASAGRVRRHSTTITIVSTDNGDVAGTLSSRRGRCERYRVVGLFDGTKLLAQTRSNSAGNFTLDGPSSGTYTVIAYKANAGCMHVCKMSSLSVSY